MKNYLLKLTSFMGALLVLASCSQLPEFTAKPLNNNAKQISVVREIPYGCRVVGNVSGLDSEHKGQRFPRLDMVREGALNDLRNNSADLLGKRQNMHVRIINEYATCFIKDCENLKDDDIVKSYHVEAQILECTDLNALSK